MDPTTMNILKTIAEDIVLFGGAAMALWIGLKRMYTTARNVEKLVEKADETDQRNVEYRENIKCDLEKHSSLEAERHVMRDKKIDIVTNDLGTLSGELRAHVKQEEARDLIRDQQLVRLTTHIDEIVSEMRPNGGSSMKDIVTKTSNSVAEINTRVAVIEEWKGNRNGGIKSTPKRKVRRK